MDAKKNGVTKILDEINKFLEENPDLLVEGGKEELMQRIMYAAVLLNRSELLKIQEYHEKYPSITWMYSKNRKIWNIVIGAFIIGSQLWLVSGFRRAILLGVNSLLGFPSIDFIDFIAPGFPLE